MLSGVLSAGLCEPGDIIVSARTQKTLDAVHEEFGVNVSSSNAEAAKAEMVILAVKPQMYESVIAEVAPSLSNEAIVVSIAPGKTLSWLAEKTGAKKIVRLMPNTPAAIGTTIEGLRVLEEKGMRSAVIESLLATIEKAKRL